MKYRVLLSKFFKNAVLMLIIILVVFTAKNALAAGKNSFFYNPISFFPTYGTYSQYLNALKPYQKGFDESLKPGKTLKDVATTLLKPNLTFNDLENLFKKQFSANPICFSQGGTPTFPPGRVFSASLCWDTHKNGCLSCACQCGYIGYIWDPTTSICGCAQ
jgi:hypothetical protein